MQPWFGKESIGIRRRRKKRQFPKNVYWNESDGKLDARQRKQAHIHWGPITAGVRVTVKAFNPPTPRESCEVQAVTSPPHPTWQEIGARSSETISSRPDVSLAQQITGNAYAGEQCQGVIRGTLWKSLQKNCLLLLLDQSCWFLSMCTSSRVKLRAIRYGDCSQITNYI